MKFNYGLLASIAIVAVALFGVYLLYPVEFLEYARPVLAAIFIVCAGIVALTLVVNTLIKIGR